MFASEVDATYEGRVTYHDSCAGLRELGVRNQPRKLLASVDGLRAFRDGREDGVLRLRRHLAVKYGEISDAIVDKKAQNIVASGAPTLLAGDLGLPDDMAASSPARGPGGRERCARRRGARHDDEPPIGERG